jgi:DNA-binding PadR family transcriptional regulator
MHQPGSSGSLGESEWVAPDVASLREEAASARRALEQHWGASDEAERTARIVTEAVTRSMLELFVLQRLARRPQHGYELLRAARQVTNEVWHPSSASVYALLGRLVESGAVTVAEAGAGRGRRARTMYALTPAGRARLEQLRRGSAAQVRLSLALWRLLAGELLGSAAAAPPMSSSS